MSPVQHFSSSSVEAVINASVWEQSLQRSSAAIEDSESAIPKKYITLGPEARVNELKAQVYELHEFILSQGVASEAPPLIRERLEAHDGAAKKLSESICGRIVEVWELLWMESGDGRKTGISSDNISSAIEGGLTLAFDLMLHLAKHSYSELDGGGGEGDRPSDEPADELLVVTLQMMEQGVVAFNPEEELASLKAQAKKLNDYEIESFFEKSIEQMSWWLELLGS